MARKSKAPKGAADETTSSDEPLLGIQDQMVALSGENPIGTPIHHIPTDEALASGKMADRFL